MGVYFDGASAFGFLRNPDGSFFKIQYPGSSNTIAIGINDAGQIVGDVFSSGFLATPQSGLGQSPSTEGAAVLLARCRRRRRSA